MKKRKFSIIALITIAVFSCKKEPKSAPSEILGTWSLYSNSNIQGPHSLISTSTEYPCMSNIKLVFNADGTYSVPSFSKCVISPTDSLGNASYITRAHDGVGKWSITDNTVTTAIFDSTTNKTISGHMTLTNANGQLQLKSVDTVYGATLTEIYIKVQ